MESHWLLILFSLNLMVMTAHGALPAELYWKRKLPATPVPKAITELLRGDVNTGKSVDTDTQLQDELVISDLGAKEIPSQENALLFYAYYVAKETQSRSFFEEYQLHAGNKFNVNLNKIKSVVPLLPREIADHIPFSLDKMNEIFEMLSVKLESKNAEIVEKTIGDCESPPMDGEERYCATSLESMVDFITSKLGNNVHAMSTEVTKETKLQNLLVKDGVEKLADDYITVCHPMAYPYVVFWCHKLQKTNAYFVPLEGEDGVRVKAVAVCHKDTSKWDPNHAAFQDLKVKPGTVPVCHFLPEGHLLWLPN
ncbi:BURP domain protein RD22-like [Lotus japonicus]|uniref:BURP domain protein RD22-like n=1 Tax=Lotus japonicus TaxID=34305 RepID=UPI0025858AE0|nr:BURP domain protein RD22-like [Lotus japonicus]